MRREKSLFIACWVHCGWLYDMCKCPERERRARLAEADRATNKKAKHGKTDYGGRKR